MKEFKIGMLILLLLFGYDLKAQQYSGGQGSVYNPVTNLMLQPAAGAEMPYSWGVQIFGLNTFWDNNIANLSPAKLDWSADSVEVDRYLITGKKKRYALLKGDVRILNFLLKIPQHETWTVGAGWNIKSHSFADRIDYDYQQDMHTLKDFLRENALHQSQKGNFMNQQWSEWFLNASKRVQEDKYHSLSVGASLKLIKGMTAEVVRLTDFGVKKGPSNTSNYLPIMQVKGRYGYAKNLEKINDAETFQDGKSALMSGNPMSIGLDLGMVFTKKEPVLIPGFTNTNPAGYSWKLSVALTDFGRLKYPLGKESRVIEGVDNPKDVRRVEDMLKNASSLTAINDSLAKMLEMTPWEDKITVSLPTMLRLSFDKKLGHHFYLNTQLNLDASWINPGVDFRSKSLSYAMVTPRWEKKRIGFYAPLYVNEKGRFLAGAAFRVGPLLAGVHDLKWLFNHSRAGGAYLSVVIKKSPKKETDCPTF